MRALTLEEIFDAYVGPDYLFSLNCFASRLMLSLTEDNLDSVASRLRQHPAVLARFTDYAGHCLPGIGWWMGDGGLTPLGPERYTLLQRLLAQLAQQHRSGGSAACWPGRSAPATLALRSAVDLAPPWFRRARLFVHGTRGSSCLEPSVAFARPVSRHRSSAIAGW